MLNDLCIGDLFKNSLENACFIVTDMVKYENGNKLIGVVDLRNGSFIYADYRTPVTKLTK